MSDLSDMPSHNVATQSTLDTVKDDASQMDNVALSSPATESPSSGSAECPPENTPENFAVRKLSLLNRFGQSALRAGKAIGGTTAQVAQAAADKAVVAGSAVGSSAANASQVISAATALSAAAWATWAVVAANGLYPHEGRSGQTD